MKDLIKLKTNKIESIRNYPFIDELVDKLYDKSINEMIDKNVTNALDKKVFLMYIMMYFVIHLQIIDINEISDKKETIKDLLNGLISDTNKRKMFIDFFDEKFKDFEFESDDNKRII